MDFEKIGTWLLQLLGVLLILWLCVWVAAGIAGIVLRLLGHAPA